jgi:hypothetical protein
VPGVTTPGKAVGLADQHRSVDPGPQFRVAVDGVPDGGHPVVLQQRPGVVQQFVLVQPGLDVDQPGEVVAHAIHREHIGIGSAQLADLIHPDQESAAERPGQVQQGYRRVREAHGAVDAQGDGESVSHGVLLRC